MRRLLMVIGVALALGLAAPAQAEPAEPGVDASFVDALNKAGISFNDPSNAVQAGHTACDLLAQGKPGMQVVHLVQQQNSGISTASAAKFTAIAVSAYCPQYAQQTGGSGGQQ